jgi:two-component system response regulator (stage 0 sporulation protein F)
MPTAKKVLVVDDERGLRYLLSDLLTSEGFEVRVAKDGQESLDQLRDRRFDLVITDIQMPRLDGIEMLKAMKKSGRKEKVIIMTGDPTDRRLSGTDMPQVVSHLQKPIQIDTFLEAVVAAMATSRKVSKRKTRAKLSTTTG